MKILICLLGMYIDYSPSVEPVYNPVFRIPNLIVVPAIINIPGLLPIQPQANPILFPPAIPPLPQLNK
jgi:hypothetical protein